MRRFIPLLLLLVACAASAQTLNVRMGSVTYAYPAEGLGNVLTSPTALTILGKEYPIEALTCLEVDNSEVEDNTVNVVYAGAEASVVVAGNIANVVSAEVNGAHVALLQGDTEEELTYTLSGSTTDGSFYMDGKLKATLVLDGVSIHNPDSAAINIQNGKRIAVELSEGSTNVLSDGLAGADDGSDAHKACFYVQGHTEFSGAGQLTITGNVKHGLSSHEYLQIKKSVGAITVASAKGDGFHVSQYYEQRGGVVSITAEGDGIDVSTTSDLTDEYNGEIIISGGTLVSTVSGSSSDAMKCDTNVTMSDGNVSLTSTGAGGRALNVNGSVELTGGYISGVTTGGTYAEGTDDERKPHAMAVDVNLTLSGGEAYFASMNNKSFKVDNIFRIDGGTHMGIGGKSVTPSAISSQGYKTYTGVKVSGGSAVSYDNVSFTVPANFSLNSAYILVSRAGL